MYVYIYIYICLQPAQVHWEYFNAMKGLKWFKGKSCARNTCYRVKQRSWAATA